MIHLFKHSKKGKLFGKFDIALVVKGKVIVFSNQGYSRKQWCYNAIISIARLVGGNWGILFQDDTLDNPSLFIITSMVKKPQPYLIQNPDKKYQP